MPVGSIVAWVPRPEVWGNTTSDLPAGWVRCDGSTIPQPSLWAGQLTPDLNGGRFLRGGEDKEVLLLEEDQVQEHLHTDPGHSHTATSTSKPHSHGYLDYFFTQTANTDNMFTGHGVGSSDSTTRTTDQVAAGVDTLVVARATGMGGVAAPAKHGTETRPKNMRVIYVIRVW